MEMWKCDKVQKDFEMLKEQKVCLIKANENKQEKEIPYCLQCKW